MLMFTMNDIGGTGSLSREEFARMLRFGHFPLLSFSFFPFMAASDWFLFLSPAPDTRQVFHRNLQLHSVEEPGGGRHRGHDAGGRLQRQGEDHVGGLPLPAARPREGAAVCSTQCQRFARRKKTKDRCKISFFMKNNEKVKQLHNIRVRT